MCHQPSLQKLAQPQTRVRRVSRKMSEDPRENQDRKMSQDEENAVKKFLDNPDLVEKLLPYLDVFTVILLAESRVSCTVKLLQKSSAVWTKLVRRTFPGNQNWFDHPSSGRYWNFVKERFEEERIQILHLTSILAMMDNPKSHTLDLLEIICEKFPPIESPGRSEFSIQLGCPCHQSQHSVSPLGFLLLEEVEGALGSAQQEVLQIKVPFLVDPLMSALGSRVSRQQVKMTRMQSGPAVCKNRKNAAHLFALMQNCESTQLRLSLHIEGNIEASGWADLARALSLLTLDPEDPPFSVNATREAMKEARREDLKAVWDLLPVSESVVPFFCWIVDAREAREYFYKVRGEEEEGWNALLKVLDEFEGDSA